MRLFFILAFVLMQYGAMAVDVPSVVTKNFQLKYPTATEVEWYEDEDGTLMVYFFIEEQSKTAKYTNTGNWIETKTFIDIKDLPVDVTNAYTEKYQAANIISITMVELPNTLNQYEINAEMNNIMYMLTFDEKGTLLKTMEEAIIDDMGVEDAEPGTYMEVDEQ